MDKQALQKMIGQNLHRARLQQNMTQDQLAEQAGISTTFLANLECGNKLMSTVTLRKLADILCVSTDSLLYEDQPNDRIRSIQMLLQDQPEEVAAFAEKLIRLCIADLPQQLARNESGEVVILDGCCVSP